MYQSGNNPYSIEHSNENNTQTLVTQKDTLTLKVNTPTLMAIPETPRRFREVKPVVVKKKAPLFIPTATDSIEFNLIERTENENIIPNSIVDDYLSPIAIGDRVWLYNEVEGIRDTLVAKPVQIKEDSPQKTSADTIAKEETIAFKDTILTTKDTTKSHLSQSEAIGQITVTQKEQPIETPHKHLNKDILSGLLILAVAIMGVLRVTNYKYLRELFTATIFSQEARKLLKTVNLHNQKASIILNFLFLFNTSIFVYEALTHYKINTFLNQSLLLIPAVMALLVGYGIIKTSLYKFIAFVFENKNETAEYLFFNYLHNKIFAMAILPIIVIIPYIDVEVLPILFKTGLILFVFLYAIQIFRGFLIILKNLASLFYLFLYLCALEILPLIILYKILIN